MGSLTIAGVTIACISRPTKKWRGWGILKSVKKYDVPG